MPPKDDVQIGSHRLAIQEDIITLVIGGAISGADAVAINQRTIVQFEKYGYALTLVDATVATSLTPEARRVGAEFRRAHPAPSSTAIFGTNLMTRAVAILAFRAMALFVRDKTIAMQMFKTEAEARTWLDQQRPVLREMAGRPYT